jgi:molybdenum cofactor cytidylyltransferase
MIAAVVLAAGSATRFGSAKVLATLDDVALVRHVVDRLALAGIDHVVVTANENAARIRDVLSGTAAVVVDVDDATTGLSASLRRGVGALPGGCTGFVVALGDQPFIDPLVVRRLEASWRRTGAAAIVPVYRDGVRGNPVFFDASMREALQSLEGDAGARALLLALGERVITVPIDAEAPRDVDTPTDLDQLGAAH